MDNPQSINYDNNEINLDAQLEAKRREVNSLRVEHKVIEEQIAQRQQVIDAFEAWIKSKMGTAIYAKDEDIEKINKEINENANKMSSQAKILKKDKIKHAKILQELKNSESELEFIIDRIKWREGAREKVDETNSIAPPIENKQDETPKTPLNTSEPKNNNPWLSGSFYVFAAIMITTTFAVIISSLPWYSVLIVFICGLFLLLFIGALQLKNDENLSEVGFIKLMIEALKSLPSILKSVLSNNSNKL